MSEVTLYQGDCLEYMQGMSAGDIVTITDPPYGVNLGNHAGANECRRGLLAKRGGYIDTPESFDLVVVPAIKRALKLSRRAAVFCVPPSMWRLPAPDAIGGIFVPGAVGRNKWGWSNFIHCLLYGIAPDLEKGAKQTAIQSSAQAEDTGHPVTKPLVWMRWIINLATRPGDVVFDPFMGSGSTGVAAIQLGRSFIGCEISEEYFKIAQKRIAQAQLQPRLFDDEPKARPVQGELL
jgi:DNA modification methylase